ncbi:MAG TPA: hypothetical protein VG033_06440 [Candidatus Acidoferrales bacterium]|jgi:hypothetical protein|nr:hypothetical protein [Candidatus Acidoferrales bacterium]
MNNIRNILLSAVYLSSWGLRTEFRQAEKTPQNDDFLIDQSKPYVYLEVDHIGPRKPLRDGEPSMGIWLRLKNNCRLPVVIIASGALADRPNEVLWVGDEVVPNRPPTGTESPGSGIGYQPGQEDLTDIFLSPNINEAEVRGAEQALIVMGQKERPKRPHGYNDGYQPGPQVLKVVSPGGEMFFSLPIDHVSDKWHFEIPFRLAIPNKGHSRAPYSYLAFYNADLPGAHGTAASTH